MNSVRNLVAAGGRSLARHLDRLRATLESLGERLRDAIARAIGHTVAEAVHEAVHTALADRPAPPKPHPTIGRATHPRACGRSRTTRTGPTGPVRGTTTGTTSRGGSPRQDTRSPRGWSQPCWWAAKPPPGGCAEPPAASRS
jgi:hypothetical protein